MYSNVVYLKLRQASWYFGVLIHVLTKITLKNTKLKHSLWISLKMSFVWKKWLELKWSVQTEPVVITISQGGAQQCGGLEGPILSHNPPLLFNVRKDPQESIPLDTSNRQYSDVLAGIEASRKLFDKDLRRDNTTVADYRSSKKFLPCCNSKDVQCRCTWQ